MKKIIFVANSPWYLHNFRERTLVEFSKHYDVVCSFPKGMENQELYGLGIPYSSFVMDPSGKNPLKELISLLSMLWCFVKEKPNLIFSFNPKTNLYALICCSILNIKCVTNVSGVGAASALGGVTGRLYSCLSSFFYKRAAFVFFQNNEDRQEFIKKGWVSESSSSVLPGSGVDLKKYKPVKSTKRITRYLMASRLIREKGVEEYINSARNVIDRGFDAEFFLAGITDDSERSVAKKIIDRAAEEGYVKFLGHVKNIPRLLNSIDCVVLPSYYPEGTPRILIEGAASGKIIITTDTPGCRNLVVPGENGFLVDPGSIEHLTQVLIKACSLCENKVSEMKDRSRSLAEEKYDEKIVVEMYLKAAREVV
ncbi:glycosyltransferase family 4 protein [Halomonas sp.]|uniref:glycosyltransferase family 4 protein n=1 Tax=Halomonas sp. TaxID=1486246 RepID=UPI000C986654|nr:glycosyltransferase family 4 protein [Halomonas sp.]MAR71618.1 hypothetical protein [Halomonas sp.]|tara:strand:- start:4553 stop:5653 length:1101 start_codon:yes stop_codon:yes gene_type:complete